MRACRGRGGVGECLDGPAGEVAGGVVDDVVGDQREEFRQDHREADQCADARRDRAEHRAERQGEDAEEGEAGGVGDEGAGHAGVGEGGGVRGVREEDLREGEGDEVGGEHGEEADAGQHGRLGPEHRQPVGYGGHGGPDLAGGVFAGRGQDAEGAQHDVGELHAEQDHQDGVDVVVAASALVARGDEQAGAEGEDDGEAEADPGGAERRQLVPLGAQDAGRGDLVRVGGGGHAAAPPGRRTRPRRGSGS